MELLNRSRIEGFVRELEAGAYGLARSLTKEQDRAEQIVVDAFGRLAPSFSDSIPIPELRERLGALIRQAAEPNRRRRRIAFRIRTESGSAEPVAAPLAVSDALHLRIVDHVEEQQNVEPIGRRRTVLLVGLGVILLGALVAVQWIRSDALAAARPTVTDRYPSPGTKEVPLDGSFNVVFGRRPTGKPMLRLEPADSALSAARWDGGTLVVTYNGLHRAKKYQLILQADYRSRFKDVGHLEQRWSFTAEGYPVLTTIAPADGQSVVARVGQLSLGFNRRPPVDPLVSITPADAVSQTGQWTGSAWTISYTGLKPITNYQATVVVDYGVASANIRRQWTFSTEPGAPPDGTSVIWYSLSPPWRTSGDPQRLMALDWSGNLAGTMYQTPPLQQAPDGSILGTENGMYFDRHGTPIAGFSGNPYVGMLADDSRSVCEVRTVSGSDQLWLFTGPFNGTQRRVAPAGVVSARSGLGVIGCSVLNDRAVVVDMGMGGTTGLRVMTLSTGRIVYSRTYSGSPVSIVSSRDGRYLAEETPSFDASGIVTGGTTVIRSTTNGAAVARLDGQRVVRFSWDDMRVVTAPFFGVLGRNEVDVTDWQKSVTVWHMPGPQGTDGSEPVFALAQPGGTEMVVGVGGVDSTGGVDGLWLVQLDGQATQVASGTLYPAFMSGF